MNPLRKLPPRLRLGVYVAATVGGLALTAYQAADGDLIEAGVLFCASLAAATAASNVDKAP